MTARYAHPSTVRITRPPWQMASVAGVLGGAFLWCYWQSLLTMADRWANDPQYSHGFLVPVFSAVILWHRRHLLAGVHWKPHLGGLPVMLVALFLRWVAVRIDQEWLDGFSLLVMMMGMVLLVGGEGVLRWAWPAVAFLAFMLPLPFQVETALAYPLRRCATILSTFALQTFGSPAVADACSGLGMLMTFFALSTLVALILPMPLTDRLIILASAGPIAVLINVVRITATGLAQEAWGKDSPAAHAIMHDLAGWLMIALSLAMLWLETRFLKSLWIVLPDDHRPLSVSMPSASRPLTETHAP